MLGGVRDDYTIQLLARVGNAGFGEHRARTVSLATALTILAGLAGAVATCPRHAGVRPDT